MADNALILLNESFATTTEKEGYEIACDVLKALSMASPKILFVTHNYHLLKNIERISKQLENGIKLRSLIVSEGNAPSDRTYKIREGKPQENIYTMDFLKRMKIL